MANDETNPAAHAAAELDLDEAGIDVDAAIRRAVKAVEEVEASAERSEETSEEEVAKLRRELEEARDRSIRTLADFDNYRKRSEREREEMRRYAIAEATREFVGVADNLERALDAGGAAEDLKRGVELILRQMQESLKRVGVREVAALGAPFDPAVHEAVAREESRDVTAPTVVAEFQRGYLLHDRLLRPAMVKVAVPAEKTASAAAAEDTPPASAE
ncbi:MAG TPA: nucleotide exchange factor GrpE [Thermoanaerobaculia bacterium]|nr:nucleotide exchange factor GrpE [Thermoanaerobaculia bacterium]